MYYLCSNDLCSNLSALLETRDINLYLKPLEMYFNEIENVEFRDIIWKLKLLFHCVCLMWSNSKYYSMERIIALLREISNLLISQVFNSHSIIT